MGEIEVEKVWEFVVVFVCLELRIGLWFRDVVWFKDGFRYYESVKFERV